MACAALHCMPPPLASQLPRTPAARDDAAEQAARARVYARSKSAQPFLGKKSLAAGSTPATDVLQPSPRAAFRSLSAPHEANTPPLDLTRRSIRSTAPGEQAVMLGVLSHCPGQLLVGDHLQRSACCFCMCEAGGQATCLMQGTGSALEPSLPASGPPRVAQSLTEHLVPCRGPAVLCLPSSR